MGWGTAIEDKIKGLLYLVTPLFHHHHHHDLKDLPHHDHHLKISNCVTTTTALPVKRMIKMLTIIRTLLISPMLDDIRLDQIESSI